MTNPTSTPITTGNSPVAIKLDADVKARIKQLAEARQRSPHWLMREAINQYIAREERRDAFHQAALQAWDAYQSTGLHVDDVRADAWLSALEAGQDIEPPFGEV